MRITARRTGALAPGGILAESGLRNGTLIGRLSTVALIGFAIYLGTSIAADASAMVG